MIYSLVENTDKKGLYNFILLNGNAIPAGQILPNLDPPPIAEMVKHFPEVEMGGRWSPSWCAARHRIAIIVPYAKREKQLQIFLFHMHTILQRQLIDYTIFIVEQVGKS